MSGIFARFRSTLRSGALAALIAMPSVTLAAPQPAALAAQAPVPPGLLPPSDMGATTVDAFVSATGHSISGYMLDYWRVNGASLVYGNPISEPFAASNGRYSQAFERGIFQFIPELMWTESPVVSLMPIGRQRINDARVNQRSDGRRTGADRRTAAWRPGSQDAERSQAVANEGGRYSQTTGFSISGPFATWYDAHEGQFYLGAPLSEPHRERGTTVQYFEGGMLQLDADDVASPAQLPKESPEQYGFDPTPVAQDGRPEYSETLFYDLENPFGVDPTSVDGPKRIVVSISEQTMRAYQGDSLVLESLISTGLDPNDTEVGEFHIRMKKDSQTMSGFTSDTGEVVGTGSKDEVNGTVTANSYEVKDVPNVMYFNTDAEALHGAYWHENFGQKMSHGCVNQPLDIAAWMYEWAPLGTPITVVE